MPVRNVQPRRTRLLIVDDQPDLADMLSHVLTDEGYDVTVFNDGSRALRYILDVQWAALILDVMMPETEGFTVLRELRCDVS